MNPGVENYKTNPNTPSAGPAYILTIDGVFNLRCTHPDMERPYRAVLYMLVAGLIEILPHRGAGTRACRAVNPLYGVNARAQHGNFRRPQTLAPETHH